jgi:type I restriction enzyme M protein
MSELGKALWKIADELRDSMNADDFRDYMLSFLFLRYLSGNYEESAKKDLDLSLKKAHQMPSKKICFQCN